MSIIQRNIDARFRLTQLISSGAGIPGVQVVRGQRYLSAYEAEQALFGVAYKQPGMPTLDDCKAILGEIHEKYGDVLRTTIFQRFGIQHIRELPLLLCRDFWLYCAAVMIYGANPEYGWTLDRISPDVRSRWLLWHPESDCLWEVHGKLAGELDSGEVSDVTGEPKFEHMFAAQNAPEEEL